jgi:phage host-nuclease inhibitor protein Gam
MALTKTQKVDKIEIVGDYKHVQVRTATVIEEDGAELSRSYHRHVIAPGESTASETAEVQAICTAMHTAEVIAAYQAHLEAQSNDI